LVVNIWETVDIDMENSLDSHRFEKVVNEAIDSIYTKSPILSILLLLISTSFFLVLFVPVGKLFTEIGDYLVREPETNIAFIDILQFHKINYIQ